MSRLLKIILSFTVFLISGAIVVLNIKQTYTMGGLIIMSMSCYYFIKTVTHDFYSGYLEEANDGINTSKDCMHNLFTSAKNSIKIVSGGLCPKIYFDPKVFNALTAAKNRGVVIDIAFTYNDIKLPVEEADNPLIKSNFNKFSEWVKKKEVSLKQIPKGTRQHFIIVDNLHVRIEDKHRPRASKRKAITDYLNPNLARKYDHRFKLLQDRALTYQFSA